MKAPKILTAAAAIVALGTQSAQAAQSANCLTQGEASGLAMAIIPGALEQTMKDCAAHLPANAGLMVNGPGALAQYRQAASAEAVQSVAGNAIAKIAGDDLPSEVPKALALSFVEAMVVGSIAKGMDEESCAIVNNVWAPLAPLPLRNLSEVVIGVALAALDDETASDQPDSKDDKKETSPLDDIEICPFISTQPAN